MVVVARVVARIAGVVRFALLMEPGGVVLIVLPDAAIEIACQSADDPLVADIGGAQAAGRESTEMTLTAR